MSDAVNNGDMRISEVAALTGLSARHWQRRAASGQVPGVRELWCGERRIFFIDREKFLPWC